MFSWIMCIGTWPGPSIIVCTSCFHAILVSSPRVSSSANCASSFASAIEPGRNPSPSEKLTSYVDPLLGLLDEHIAEDLPGELLGPAVDLLERLVDRHRPDGDRRV